MIASELKATYLVTGSMSEADGRLIFRFALTDAASGTQVWSNKFDRPITELYELQDQVVQDLATSIFSEVQAFEIRSIKRQACI